jgi:hypothetical protein
MLRCVALAAALASTVLFGSATAADDKSEGFTDLFNGRDLRGWKTFLSPKAKDADPAKTWTVKDGVIICTGHPNGFFYTDKSYKDYVLLYDWLYKRPEGLTNEDKFLGNSGCLVHIHDPEKPVAGGVWPQCVEVQGMNRDHGRLIPLRTKGEGKFDREAKNKATHPVGEWNTTEIICKGDGSITAKINGTRVSSGRFALTEGRIGFQSEGAEIHFRNIKIKERK